jgi:predicted RNA binding protein YcfA (HicA-like mRNA interferase family)
MPSATARDFQRVAKLLGFIFIRQTSHERWNHPDGSAVTIPVGYAEGRSDKIS